MPKKPNQFRIAAPSGRKPYERVQPARTVTGHAAMDRARRIKTRDNFTCYMCGRITDELEVDHIQPIAQGGSENDDNLASICKKPCHRIKSYYESRGLSFKGNPAPFWLDLHACHVVVVAGPPCAGKTTWTQQYADALVIDCDDIAIDAFGKELCECNGQEISYVLQQRNELLEAVQAGNNSKHVLLIATCPTPWHRSFWQQRGCTVHVVNTPRHVCIERLNERNYCVEIKNKLINVIQKWH
jgi:5-methylcytosine-specific restriction protein A